VIGTVKARRRWLLTWRALLVLAGTAALPFDRAAHAQISQRPAPASEHATAQQARAFFEIGAQAYGVGDYVAALDAFREAYALEKRPGLLFSMAQAHRRAFFASNDGQHLRGAIEGYRAYLSTAAQSRRPEAEHALAELVPLGNSVTASTGDSQQPKASTKLMIASFTPGATLRVDGVLAPHLPYVAAVTPGAHQIELSAPGFRSQVRELLVPEGAALALELRLEELPGTLAVTGTAGSQVWIDGRLIGSLPLPPISLSARPHQVSAGQVGHRLLTRKVSIEADRIAKVDLSLVHTWQRDMSHVLLWSGAGLLLAGAGTGIAAYSRQLSASSLHEARSRGETLTSEWLDRYERARSQRDQLRVIAWSLGGAGLANLLLGGTLFIFDHPEAPALLDPGDPAPAPTSVSTELIGSAGWGDGRFGIEARGEF
jgi:hypothetical protein